MIICSPTYSSRWKHDLIPLNVQLEQRLDEFELRGTGGEDHHAIALGSNHSIDFHGALRSAAPMAILSDLTTTRWPLAEAPWQSRAGIRCAAAAMAATPLRGRAASGSLLCIVPNLDYQ